MLLTLLNHAEFSQIYMTYDPRDVIICFPRVRARFVMLVPVTVCASRRLLAETAGRFRVSRALPRLQGTLSTDVRAVPYSCDL